MSQVVIFGPPASSYVRTTRMVCIEKQVPHTLEPVPSGEAHQKLHPWARVPVMRHGEVTLYESSAIDRYVDELGSGPKLVPSTIAARGVMEQWISAINCYVYDSVIRRYALVYVGAMLRKEAPDPAQIAAGVPAMQRDLAQLDAAYAGGAWIAGDSLSLADLLVAPIVATIAMLPEGKAALASAGHLSRVLATVAQRESFAKVHEGLSRL
jgi:glutathione S-transferase